VSPTVAISRLEPAPDPRLVRGNNLTIVERLGLPTPPPGHPLVWESGDDVALRPVEEIEARAAILNIVLARSFGMPSELAMQWLLSARLVDHLTPPEWKFVASGEGDYRSFALHLEALFALAWVLGLAEHLDPREPSSKDLVQRFPNLPAGETFAQWQARTLLGQREPSDVAAMLDLYYCMDWAYLEAERTAVPLPGLIDSNAIGQRRWSLEWVTVLKGPYHDDPPGWEEVDLST
jgi:hypothetical protein